MNTRIRTANPGDTAIETATGVLHETTDTVATATHDTTSAMRDTAGAASSAMRDTSADAAATLRQSTETAAAAFQSGAADTQKTMTEQFEKLSKGFEGLTAFNQQNMDALVKSSEIAAKAAEGIGSEVSAYSRRAFEDTVAAAQKLAAAKTMTEVLEKQAAFAQSAFEGFVAQSTKMNEIFVAATKDISAPLGARVSVATERMKSFAL